MQRPPNSVVMFVSYGATPTVRDICMALLSGSRVELELQYTHFFIKVNAIDK